MQLHELFFYDVKFFLIFLHLLFLLRIQFQQECPKLVSEIEREKLNFSKLNYLLDLYLRPLLKKNIQELILGCSHYPLIYDFLRKKIDSNIKIIDPSEALIKNLRK